MRKNPYNINKPRRRLVKFFQNYDMGKIKLSIASFGLSSTITLKIAKKTYLPLHILPLR